MSIEHHRRTNKETLVEALSIEQHFATKLGGKAVWEIGRQALQYELVDPNNYLADVRNLVSPIAPEQKPVGVLVGLNHITMADPALVLELIHDHIAPLDQVVAISAKKYLDKKRFPGMIIAPIASMASSYKGFRIEPVVHDRPGEEEYYLEHPEAIDRHSPLIYNGKALVKAGNELENAKIIVLAPEAHRSDTGELQKGKPVSRILKRGGEGSVYLPIAVIPPIKGKITPFKTKAKLRVGKPVTYQEMEDEMEILNNKLKLLVTGISAKKDETHQLTLLDMDDMLMWQIAKLTPEDRLGYYREYMHLLQPTA
jgi:1-acyl-sn-glycerol-3-phosphate acyltransferase